MKKLSGPPFFSFSIINPLPDRMCTLSLSWLTAAPPGRSSDNNAGMNIVMKEKGRLPLSQPVNSIRGFSGTGPGPEKMRIILERPVSPVKQNK
jgi:hypothetical protein